MATQNAINAPIPFAKNKGGTGTTNPQVILNYIEEITTARTIAVNQGYIANNAAAVVFTLPSTAAVGDVFEIVGKGAGGWSIAQGAGQSILFGDQASASGAGGSLASTNLGDVIRAICTTANTTFRVVNAIGNITVV